jgi:hypothetical protein
MDARPQFQWPRAFHSLCHCCSRLANFLVAVDYLHTTLAVCNQYQRVASACRASSVLTPLTLRSLRVIRRPVWRCARHANIPVATCRPIAALPVCNPYWSVPCTHRAAGVLALPTIPLSCTICSPHRQFGHPVHFTVSEYHLLSPPLVWQTRQRSFHHVLSDRRIGHQLALVTCSVRSHCWACAHPVHFPVIAWFPLAAPEGFSAHRLSSRREVSARRDNDLPAAPTFWS